MTEGPKTIDPLEKAATDWRWRYQEVRQKLEECLRESADLRYIAGPIGRYHFGFRSCSLMFVP